MEIIREISNKLDYPNSVVAIGNFDGVHIGHQKIFRKVVEKADEINGTPVAVTFEPHPAHVLSPKRKIKMLTSFKDRARLISNTGIKVLVSITFSKEFARMEPDDFVKDIVVDKFNAKWLIMGHNYSFGRNKKGTTLLLRRSAKRYGFRVSVVRGARIYADIVSSSRIRDLLSGGRVCEASEMLGRGYHIEGVVIKGDGRGMSLFQTPTANITAPAELVPLGGVYAVRVSIGKSDNTEGIACSGGNNYRHVYDGVANIGSNPTFGGATPSREVHIFDFSGDITGKRLRIYFIDRIREEKKFPDIKELKENIARDIEKAKQILMHKKKVPCID
ncbi:bifunctional riboflavin kinase/FAD synthetase [Thermodesulfovibrionales bacterium]|nr:bifunctional riboflavin kinase/FAD synthetase [Thermodesulfovibrionales bacterium]